MCSGYGHGYTPHAAERERGAKWVYTVAGYCTGYPARATSLHNGSKQQNSAISLPKHHPLWEFRTRENTTHIQNVYNTMPPYYHRITAGVPGLPQ